MRATLRHATAPALHLLFIGRRMVLFERYGFRVAAWASEWSSYAEFHPLEREPVA